MQLIQTRHKEIEEELELKQMNSIWISSPRVKIQLGTRLLVRNQSAHSICNIANRVCLATWLNNVIFTEAVWSLCIKGVSNQVWRGIVKWAINRVFTAPHARGVFGLIRNTIELGPISVLLEWRLSGYQYIYRDDLYIVTELTSQGNTRKPNRL